MIYVFLDLVWTCAFETHVFSAWTAADLDARLKQRI